MGNAYTGTGVSEKTPKNLLLGAGTIHKGLKYANGKWNFEESLVGATSGGSKLSIKPELFNPELDNVMVKVKGMDFKMGETANIEINFAELSADIIKTAVIGVISKNKELPDFDLIESSPDIQEGDYWENVAFVGQKTDGTNIIAILDNVICTSGFEIDAKNKDTAKPKITFECTQKPDGDTRILPYHIYYPKTKQTEIQVNSEQQTNVNTEENQEG